MTHPLIYSIALNNSHIFRAWLSKCPYWDVTLSESKSVHSRKYWHRAFVTEVDSGGQGWTGVRSIFGHCLVIVVGEGFTGVFVGWFELNQHHHRWFGFEIKQPYCIQEFKHWFWIRHNQMLICHTAVHLSNLNDRQQTSKYSILSTISFTFIHSTSVPTDEVQTSVKNP